MVALPISLLHRLLLCNFKVQNVGLLLSFITAVKLTNTFLANCKICMSIKLFCKIFLEKAETIKKQKQDRIRFKGFIT